MNWSLWTHESGEPTDRRMDGRTDSQTCDLFTNTGSFFCLYQTASFISSLTNILNTVLEILDEVAMIRVLFWSRQYSSHSHYPAGPCSESGICIMTCFMFSVQLKLLQQFFIATSRSFSWNKLWPFLSLRPTKQTWYD